MDNYLFSFPYLLGLVKQDLELLLILTETSFSLDLRTRRTKNCCSACACVVGGLTIIKLVLACLCRSEKQCQQMVYFVHFSFVFVRIV